MRAACVWAWVAFSPVLGSAWGQSVPSTGSSTTVSEPSRPPTVSVKEGKDHLVKRVDARTSPIALAAHVSGTVVIGAEIDATGRVTQVVALSGPELLRASAVDAVKQYEFRPFLIDGVPAVVRTAIQVRFDPGHTKSSN